MNPLVLKIGSGIGLLGAATLGGYGISKFREPNTIEEHLINDNLKPLDTTPLGDNPTASENYTDWQEKIKEETTNSGWKTFAGWTEGTSENSETQKINKLKSKCADKLKITKGSSGFETDLADTKKYCVKTKVN